MSAYNLNLPTYSSYSKKPTIFTMRQDNNAQIHTVFLGSDRCNINKLF